MHISFFLKHDNSLYEKGYVIYSRVFTPALFRRVGRDLRVGGEAGATRS